MIKKISAGTAASALLLVPGVAANAADTPVYMETVANGAQLSVLSTVGDSINGYYWPGIPDGLGAYSYGSYVKVLMNHEITALAMEKVTRAGGNAAGTTISEFTIDPTTGKIISAKDAIKTATFFNYKTGKFSKTAVAPSEGAVLSDSYGKYHTNSFSRFCSSSYAPAGTFATKLNGKTVGYTGGLYLTGEEIGDEGRGFVMDNAGNIVHIPRLGLSSWETFSAVRTGSINTAIIGTEDGADGTSEFWLYQGKKTSKGTFYDKAGLTNGKNYVLAVAGATSDTEFRAAYGKGKATPISFEEIDWKVGGTLQNNWANIGFGFSAIEDGAFDPRNPNTYYFVQKSSAKDSKATSPNPDDKTVTKRDGGALWKVVFNDIKNPVKGGTLELVLDGSEAPYLNMPDNIDIDENGNILIQEDPGKNAQLSRVIAYNIDSKKFAVIAKFKDQFFGPNAAGKITEDEESSGIIDVTKLFRKDASDKKSYYLLDAQVHASTEAARPDITDATAKANLASLIEGGQFYLLTIDDWSKVAFK